MPSMRSIGFMLNDPQRGHVAFRALRQLCSIPSDVDGMGVATAVDGSVLVSRKPNQVDGNSLDTLMGPLKGRCGLVRLRSQNELRPKGNTPNNLGPFRMRHYGGAVVGGAQDADEAAHSRDELLKDLPDFLRRSVAGHSEGEAFFFAVLGWMHQHSTLERMVQGHDLVRGIQATLEKSEQHPRQIVMITGLETIIVTHQMHTAIVNIAGLSEEIATEVDPCLVETSISRQRLRQFKGAFALGALEGAIEGSPAPDAGTQVMTQGSNSAWVIGRDLQATAV